MNLSSNWNFPTSVRIGRERLKEIGDCCQNSNISKPLIVTDHNLKDHKITHRLISEIDINNLSHSLFHEVDPNPNEKNLADGITKLKSYRNQLTNLPHLCQAFGRFCSPCFSYIYQVRYAILADRMGVLDTFLQKCGNSLEKQRFDM